VRKGRADSKGAKTVSLMPTDKAVFYRPRPLVVGGVGFLIHRYLEALYGKIELGDQRVDTVKGLLDYVTDFANHTEVQFLPRTIWASSTEDSGAQALLRELSAERVEARRTEMLTVLRAAVHGPAVADDLDFSNQPEHLIRQILDLAKQVNWIMSLDRDVGWRSYGVIQTADAFVSVVMSVLLDEKSRSLLCQCRNSQCGKFFAIDVERTEDKPRKLYCGAECMHAVNAAGSAARQRDRYKRNRAADILAAKGYRSVATRAAVKQVFKVHPTATAEQLAAYAKALVQTGRKAK
jgi:hypothetical protein